VTGGSKFQTALPVKRIIVKYPYTVGLPKKTNRDLNKCDARTVQQFEFGYVDNLVHVFL
jgi:hypothetical protein